MSLKRAQGCLLGQLAGDALGSLVEFQSASTILRRYPEGVRDLANGGTWNTLAGQPTDDSEMALLLARLLADLNAYDQQAALDVYRFWLDSDPFDCGMTIQRGLRGEPDAFSQANGALMRISPLGIFGASHPLEEVALWARQDALLTHPHHVCVQANELYAMAIAHAIASGDPAEAIYGRIRQWAEERDVEQVLKDTIKTAADTLPEDYLTHQGWVLIALQNALWHLLHSESLEHAVIGTVMQGGDTDTNAAICGALFGAVHGIDAVPLRWRDTMLSCRPEKGRPGVHRPRPVCFWPVDAMELAADLVQGERVKV